MNADDLGLDKHSFDFYNVMLVKICQVAEYYQSGGDHPNKGDLVCERIGLGLLQYKSLRWALPPGPVRSGIVLQ